MFLIGNSLSISIESLITNQKQVRELQIWRRPSMMKSVKWIMVVGLIITLLMASKTDSIDRL
jgi:hypothetical protein